MPEKLSEPSKFYKSIKQWNEDEQPREKIKKHGAATLSNAEILAVLLREGTRNLSAIDVGNIIIEKFGDLNTFSSADISELMQIKGIGEAKAIILLAAIELSKRITREELPEKFTINNTSDVAKYFQYKFRNNAFESLAIAVLNSANQIIREEIISKGILNSTMAHPREIFRYAIIENAASIILVHNHPSGICTPSKDDIELTKQVYSAGKVIGIKLLDHLIVSNDDYYSFYRAGHVIE